jgi:S-DNA-T family DNA segregation ATPase FtsK/SpoIIIE
VIAVLITLDVPLKIRLRKKKTDEVLSVSIPEEKEIAADPAEEAEEVHGKDGGEEEGRAEEILERKTLAFPRRTARAQRTFKNYVPPPLSILKSVTEKPTTGDLRANANIIKRTLESFGIPVEMGEINIGPKVTRYTLKPAEGVKLSRITALNQDLALALAAHPIRIEAPIPGKSLVGIEVPNKAAALVRLGSLMAYPDFQESGLLGFALGRDVTGEAMFADIERMPHLLVAGATGSGKSVAIHSLIISLLYKNSPATLKLVLVDPKRVELSVYENIPHLISPVITESKKAAGVFRWAIAEMERRYDLLLHAGSRDIKSYNVNGGKDDPLPYLLIVVDELADLMTSYGREVEGSIVRLAQMARATGLHLVLSTQRPSVEVITGLIKANITSRIALQVASQVDSRTIIDTSGAEKLLGGGDLLFISSDLSKPKRIQGAYISEEEINAVADFIRENNAREEEETEEMSFAPDAARPEEGGFDDYMDGENDELFDEALKVVGEAKKASASLLQRRLKVGYARAARLLDLMEHRGLIGPGEGAKPREVFLEKIREL